MQSIFCDCKKLNGLDVIGFCCKAKRSGEAYCVGVENGRSSGRKIGENTIARLKMRVTGKISADVLESYGPADRTRADALLQKEVAENRRKIIVLDDDPTRWADCS